MRLSVRLNTLGYNLKMLIPQGATFKLTFCNNLPVVYKRWRFAKFNGKIVAGAGSTLLFLVVQTQFSVRMPRYKDEPPAVRVYTVCDESRYLIVRNVPSLGCGDELLKLFATYGDIEECKPMDAEECEAYTDVYWIKFCLVSNARFAKRKLDEFVFLGNRLQVSYAPQFESLEDTKEKLETRRKEVLGRLNPNKVKVSSRSDTEGTRTLTYAEGQVNYSTSQQVITSQAWDPKIVPHGECSQITRVSSEQDYFISNSMNQTVHLVRDKLDKIQSTGSEPATKKARLDNRRRI